MMKTSHDIQSMQQQAGGEFLPFGDAQEGPLLEVVQTFGFYEAEYAVLRKGVGILHQPWRGLLRLTGLDVKDFLHRLLTQDVNSLKGGDSRRSFLLNVKGRIMADLWVHHGDADTWLDMDAMDLAGVQSYLEQMLFAEQVTMENISEGYTCIGLHGPGAGDLLQKVIDEVLPPALEQAGTHHVLKVGGVPVTAYRHDQVGAMGMHLWIPAASAGMVYEQLTQAVGGIAPDHTPKVSAGEPKLQAESTGEGQAVLQGRGIGWLAFNTARIEAGVPLFHVDFGPDCLPHETSLLQATTSFTKGCYVGQEIVARMQNLGHPKRVLVGWRCEDDRLPISGAAVHETSESALAQAVTPSTNTPAPSTPVSTVTLGSPGDVIGAVTSSTVSPMLGGIAVGLAMMRYGKHQPGTKVLVPAEGQWVAANLGSLPT